MNRLAYSKEIGAHRIPKARPRAGAVAVLLVIVLFTASFAAAADESLIRRATEPAGVIRLTPSRAVEIECSRDITRIAVGNPDIADIMLVPGRSPRMVRIIGKAAGATNLIVWFGEGNGHEYELLIDAGYRVEVINGTATDPEGSLKGW